MGIGQRLRYLREQNAMTVARLASLLDVEPDYVRQLERGQVNPTGRILERLSEVFHVRPGFFITSDRETKAPARPVGERTAKLRKLLDFSDFDYFKKTDSGGAKKGDLADSVDEAVGGGLAETAEEAVRRPEPAPAPSEAAPAARKEGGGAESRFSDTNPIATAGLSGVVGTTIVKDLPDLSALTKPRTVEVTLEPSEEAAYLAALVEILIRKGITTRKEFENTLDLVRMRLREQDEGR